MEFENKKHPTQEDLEKFGLTFYGADDEAKSRAMSHASEELGGFRATDGRVFSIPRNNEKEFYNRFPDFVAKVPSIGGDNASPEEGQKIVPTLEEPTAPDRTNEPWGSDSALSEEQEKILAERDKEMALSKWKDSVVGHFLRNYVKPVAGGLAGLADLPVFVYDLAKEGVNYLADDNIVPSISDIGKTIAASKGVEWPKQWVNKYPSELTENFVDNATLGLSEGEYGAVGHGIKAGTSMYTGGVAKNAIEVAKNAGKAAKKVAPWLGDTGKDALIGAGAFGYTADTVDKNMQDYSPIVRFGTSLGAGMGAAITAPMLVSAAKDNAFPSLLSLLKDVKTKTKMKATGFSHENISENIQKAIDAEININTISSKENFEEAVRRVEEVAETELSATRKLYKSAQEIENNAIDTSKNVSKFPQKQEPRFESAEEAAIYDAEHGIDTFASEGAQALKDQAISTANKIKTSLAEDIKRLKENNFEIDVPSKYLTESMNTTRVASVIQETPFLGDAMWDQQKELVRSFKGSLETLINSVGLEKTNTNIERYRALDAFAWHSLPVITGNKILDRGIVPNKTMEACNQIKRSLQESTIKTDEAKKLLSIIGELEEGWWVGRSGSGHFSEKDGKRYVSIDNIRKSRSAIDDIYFSSIQGSRPPYIEDFLSNKNKNAFLFLRESMNRDIENFGRAYDVSQTKERILEKIGLKEYTRLTKDRGDVPEEYIVERIAESLGIKQEYSFLETFEASNKMWHGMERNENLRRQLLSSEIFSDIEETFNAKKFIDAVSSRPGQEQLAQNLKERMPYIEDYIDMARAIAKKKAANPEKKSGYALWGAGIGSMVAGLFAGGNITLTGLGGGAVVAGAYFYAMKKALTSPSFKKEMILWTKRKTDSNLEKASKAFDKALLANLGSQEGVRNLDPHKVEKEREKEIQSMPRPTITKDWLSTRNKNKTSDEPVEFKARHNEVYNKPRTEEARKLRKGVADSGITPLAAHAIQDLQNDDKRRKKEGL